MKFIQLLFFLSFITLSLQAQNTYFCTPCGQACDQIAYEGPGQCNQCGMELIKRTQAEQEAEVQNSGPDQPRILFYLHDGIEVLDWAGPAEAFTTAGFEVVTVTVDGQPVTSQGVFRIEPMYSIDDAPPANMLAFFGGNAGQASDDPRVLNWLKARTPEADIIFSVCTGAFFLARAGLLDHQVATTFHDSIDYLKELAPKAEIIEGVKYVDNGKIVTAAGVSSGIHGALHLIKRLKGKKKALQTAEYMEYENWKENGYIVKQE
jgi:transcriptional regulator GlxA family with amidase domain/DNA-directed RNA polymerase subunit RPC12/RpoP